MAGFVKEVADSDDSGGLSGEVHRERGSRAAEDPDNGVELLSAALEICAGDGEVRAVECGDCEEEHAILLIEKLVGFECRLRANDEGNGLCGDGWRVRSGTLGE